MGPGIVPPPVVSPTDWRKSAFDLAADSTKQLITVATGVVAATGLLSKDLEGWARWFAGLSWGAYVLSVLCGLFVLYNMSGTLFDSARNWGHPDLYEKGITDFSIGQLVLFLVGTLLMALAFVTRSSGSVPAQTQPITVNHYLAQPAQPVPPNDDCLKCAGCCRCDCDRKKKPPEPPPPPGPPREK